MCSKTRPSSDAARPRHGGWKRPYPGAANRGPAGGCTKRGSEIRSRARPSSDVARPRRGGWKRPYPGATSRGASGAEPASSCSEDDRGSPASRRPQFVGKRRGGTRLVRDTHGTTSGVFAQRSALPHQTHLASGTCAGVCEGETAAASVDHAAAAHRRAWNHRAHAYAPPVPLDTLARATDSQTTCVASVRPHQRRGCRTAQPFGRAHQWPLLPCWFSTARAVEGRTEPLLRPCAASDACADPGRVPPYPRARPSTVHHAGASRGSRRSHSLGIAASSVLAAPGRERHGAHGAHMTSRAP